MTRKIWVLAASLAILAFGVAACGSDDNSSSSSSTPSSLAFAWAPQFIVM